MPESQFVQTFCGTANQQVIAILLKALLHLGYFPRSMRQVLAQVQGCIVEQLGHVQDESRHCAWQIRTWERHVAKFLSFIGWQTATKQDKRELEVWLRQERGGSAPTSEKLLEFVYQRLRRLRIELEYSL